MQLIPLSTNARANSSALGFTHALVLDHTDLTISTVTTGQVFTLSSLLQPNDVVCGAGYNLVTAFKNSKDAASILTTAIFGDSNDTDAFIPSTEMNAHSTPIVQRYNYLSGDDMPVVYSAAADLVLTIAAPTTGKKLSDIDTGRAIFYLALFRPQAIGLI
jgi:hypothetical protein